MESVADELMAEPELDDAILASAIAHVLARLDLDNQNDAA
jgi:hypothetical protein